MQSENIIEKIFVVFLKDLEIFPQFQTDFCSNHGRLLLVKIQSFHVGNTWKAQWHYWKIRRGIDKGNQTIIVYYNPWRNKSSCNLWKHRIILDMINDYSGLDMKAHSIFSYHIMMLLLFPPHSLLPTRRIKGILKMEINAQYSIYHKQ